MLPSTCSVASLPPIQLTAAAAEWNDGRGLRVPFRWCDDFLFSDYLFFSLTQIERLEEELEAVHDRHSLNIHHTLVGRLQT